MNAKSKIPAIRFEGFSEKWETQALQSIAEVLDGDRGINYPNGNDLQASGHTLFLSASNITSKGFKLSVNQYISEEKSNSMGNGKLVFDDIVLTSRGSVGHIGWYNEKISQQVPFVRINSGMLIIRSKKQFAPSVITQFLKSPVGKKKIDLISFGSAQPQLTKMSVATYTVNLPPEKKEQTKIGNYFQQLDTLIALHQKKHDKLLNLKKALLEKLFPKQGTTEPEIRFKGFSGEWEERGLHQVATYRNGKAHEQSIAANGSYIVVNSKFVSTDGGVKKYSNKQISPLLMNEVCFVLSDVPNGKAIARTFLISEDNLYTLNQRIAGITPSKNAHHYFLYILLNRNSYFLKFDDGAKQTNLSVSDVESFTTPYPSVEEQTKIGNLFKQLDTLITQHQTQLKKLNNIKQACLEKMFV